MVPVRKYTTPPIKKQEQPLKKELLFSNLAKKKVANEIKIELEERKLLAQKQASKVNENQ